jgi:hypothetical protein
MRIPSPAPTTAIWPSYAATEYDKRGQPALTRKQLALIRYTLSLLKPCQAALLRYAFPNWRYWGSPRGEMVLFFQPRDTSSWPNVLWSQGLGYKADVGQEFAESAGMRSAKGQGSAYEVVHQSCHRRLRALTKKPTAS